MRRELVALKVTPETRRRIKVLAAEQQVEMAHLIHRLVESEWLKFHPAEEGEPTSN